MRLYQHSARCPVALRSFLDCNPIYWCFIPMLRSEAQAENMVFFRGTSNSDPELTNVIMMGAFGNHRVAHYLDHVPLTPAAYSFTYRQRQTQRLFFEHSLFPSVQQLSYSPVDLYEMPIIVVRK